MELKLHNLRIGTRVALALALPMTGLFALSIWILSGYYRTAHDMERLRKLAEIAPAVSSLVHAVQRERGISASFIGSAGTAFAERLPARYMETDAQRAAFGRSLAYFDAARFGENLATRIARAEEKLGHIGTWRSALAERTITAPDLTDQYSGLVEELIGIVEEMRLFSTDVALTRTITAYTSIMHTKERAGLERAIGAAGFAAGRFDPAAHARFIQLIERQRLHQKEFLLFATPRQTALLDRAFAGFDATELERMQQLVTGAQSSDAVRRIDAAHWFDTISQKVDRLKTVEDDIAAELVAMASQAETAAKHAAWRISALTTALLVLTVALATILARGIIHPLARITRSMSKLAARDESITIDDDRRGDEIGDMARALIVFRDNLLQVAQAEERLKNEAILRLHHEALGAISQGVLITDAQRRITYANPAFQRISGYTEAEILGVSPSFLHNKGGDADILGQLREALASGRHFHGNLLNYMKDGTPFWSDLSINPVLDADGHPTHFVGVTRDITENRLMQQELRIAATAFESLHGIMVTDANGIILRVNNAFTEMTGYTAAEAVGKTPAILKSGRHEPEFYADMWRQLSTTGAWYGEVWDRRKNGEIFPKWQTISAVSGLDARTTHYVAAFSDISESKAAEDEIRHLAFYDPLTLLPNRRLLLDRLQQALAASARNQRYGALLFIDLDNFKNLNDTFGHDKGDLLLQQVAGRLTECVREGDTVARLGGDEFVLMLEDLSGKLTEAAAHTEMVGEKILAALNEPYQLARLEYHSTPSIGVTLFRGHDTGIDELLKQADLAMYQAKAAGRNTLRFFRPDMQATVTARSALESDLRKGLQDNQFL
ncbi:MAG: diguanylate cyclase, partial [Rhodocyclaceae bacterium]|nr:diguanylate cyclase [Rhodocyclaceae bacterium]